MQQDRQQGQYARPKATRKQRIFTPGELIEETLRLASGEFLDQRSAQVLFIRIVIVPAEPQCHLAQRRRVLS